MARQEIRRSISFPVDLWKAIDADAESARRSSVKQMEVVLSAYYGIEVAEDPASRMREVFQHGLERAIPAEYDQSIKIDKPAGASDSKKREKTKK